MTGGVLRLAVMVYFTAFKEKYPDFPQKTGGKTS
jgi:hypothetical protein